MQGVFLVWPAAVSAYYVLHQLWERKFFVAQIKNTFMLP